MRICSPVCFTQISLKAMPRYTDVYRHDHKFRTPWVGINLVADVCFSKMTVVQLDFDNKKCWKALKFIHYDISVNSEHWKLFVVSTKITLQDIRIQYLTAEKRVIMWITLSFKKFRQKIVFISKNSRWNFLQLHLSLIHWQPLLWRQR